ncbi:hypothetical protein [Nitrosopumilus adriaticus]|uniref:Uncharacterized protein n=1 Tax=Nitrosopumilus adriaticus TaxID=1580092 RepID=A0A0D5C1Q4_9ARCH|nr:hypothetical protein [Nitrosopumilus adriaticus]AJW70307.1 exported protein of unknown function [Nitrosopumilus adriaticus]
MKTRLLIFFLMSTGVVMTANAVPMLDPTHAFDFSEIVIVGKILSVEILSEPEISKTENTYREVSGIALYDIQVVDSFKNPDKYKSISVPGLFLRDPHGMSYETYPYEVGQHVLLYLQENQHGYAGTDLIIRSGDSRLLEGELCESGYYFDKGHCVVVDDSVQTPLPSCKSGPSPDGDNWVFFDCKWVVATPGWIFEDGIWKDDPSVQRTGPAPLPTCPRIDICTCSGNVHYYNSTDQQCHLSPYLPDSNKKLCEEFSQMEIDGWQFNSKYCDWEEISEPYMQPPSDSYKNDESLRLASEKVGIGGLGIDPEYDVITILVGVGVAAGILFVLLFVWRLGK